MRDYKDEKGHIVTRDGPRLFHRTSDDTGAERVISSLRAESD